MDTKACNLTEDEVKELLRYHGMQLYPNNMATNVEDTVERINYLNKRLKTFGEKEETANKEPTPIPTPPLAPQAWGNQ